MDLTFTVIIFLSLLFIALNLLIGHYISQTFNSGSKDSPGLKFSIIVAAKNESSNIKNLVAALKEQDYPSECFEAVFVDDNSTDGTKQILEEETKGITRFQVVSAENKTLPAKKGALTIGINQSESPYIIITDADCRPQGKWLKAFSDKFQEGYDFLFGVVPFYRTGPLINSIACFENLRSSLLTISAAASSLPYSAAARSFAFKREAFRKVNGYNNTLDTVSGDDDLLIREAVRHKLKVGVVTAKDSFVYSKTPASIREYFAQKARHTSTSHHYLPKHKFLLGSWHLINLFFLVSPALCLITPYLILLFLSKIFTDIYMVINYQKKFGYRFRLAEIIYLQIFYEIFIIVSFLNSAFGKRPAWK